MKKSLKYNTSGNLFKKSPRVAEEILSLGMSKYIFQQITGNFDDFDLSDVIYNDHAIEDSVEVKSLPALPLFGENKKTIDIYFGAELPENNVYDVINTGSYKERVTFFSMVGHILQNIRYHFPMILFKEHYKDTSRFEVDLVFPINENHNVYYYKKTIEFLRGNTFSKNEEAIKIICDTEQHLEDYKMLRKVKVDTENNSNSIYAFYTEDNSQLPLYIAGVRGRSINFSGESFFSSSLFRQILRINVSAKDKLSEEETLQSTLNVFDKNKRMFNIVNDASVLDSENSLVKFNDDLSDYIKQNIISGWFMQFTPKEMELIKDGLFRGAISNLLIADEIAFQKGNPFGINSYLIQSINEVLNSKLVKKRLDLEQRIKDAKEETPKDIEEEFEGMVKKEDSTEQSSILAPSNSEESSKEEQKENTSETENDKEQEIDSTLTDVPSENEKDSTTDKNEELQNDREDSQTNDDADKKHSEKSTSAFFGK